MIFLSALVLLRSKQLTRKGIVCFPIQISKIFLVAALISLSSGCVSSFRPGSPTDDHSVSTAFEQRKSDVQVEGQGLVTRILSDDREGSRHQRFIVRLGEGQTVLIQHNIDLAPRVADLKVGDSVAFFGEYVWNEHGGLVHWTHHDPARRHVGGWVKHNGRTYE